MAHAVLNPPNAILFVLDPTNKSVEVPRYVEGELTAATSTCVSVGTQSEVDGDVEVSLDIGPAGSIVGLEEVFSGMIAVPGGRVAVVTSTFERVLEADVPVGTVRISIGTDDPRNPARIAIYLGP